MRRAQCNLFLRSTGLAFILISMSSLVCLLAGCHESGVQTASGPALETTISGQAKACPFGLCDAAIPTDSAGMAALAAQVRDSATALGLAWLEAVTASGNPYAPRPETAQVILAGKLDYTLRIGQDGLFPRISVNVHVTGSAGGLDLRAKARIGQRKTLSGFPAVGRIDYDPNLGLAGATSVYGPMLMWRGDLFISSDYETRYTGSTRTPTVWKADNPIWKNLPFTFPGAIEWMAAADSLLGSDAPEKAGAPEDWYLTRVIPAGTVFKDTTLAGARLISKGKITFAAGTKLSDCLVLAGEAAIEGDANIAASLVYGRDRLLVTGTPALTGQFLARDSLYLNVDAPFTEYPIFYLHGNPRKSGGHLIAAKASGEAVLFYGGAYHPQYESEVHLVTEAAVDITGLIYANGSATIGGTTHGSVLMAKPIWMGRTGTTYVGFLMNAQFYPPDASAVLSLPLLLNPLEATVLSQDSATVLKAR